MAGGSTEVGENSDHAGPIWRAGLLRALTTTQRLGGGSVTERLTAASRSQWFQSLILARSRTA